MLLLKEFEEAIEAVVDGLSGPNAVDEAAVPESELGALALNKVEGALDVVADKDEFAQRDIAEDAPNVAENAPVPKIKRDFARDVAASAEGETVGVCVAANCRLNRGFGEIFNAGPVFSLT